MKSLILFSIFSFMTIICFAAGEKEEEKSTLEKQGELINFNSIKKILKNDMLSQQAKKKTTKIKKAKKNRIKKQVNKYNVPPREKFWSFFSEYWLVKNAPITKWDFQKPDYGIEKAFTRFLEKMGHFEKRFNILLVNTPDICHFALPSNSNSITFLLSVPFIRTLDLSKLEISLLLFEDYLRLQKDYFIDYVSSNELKKLIGTNFHNKKLSKKVFDNTLKKYDEIIFDKGFTFQQQFDITQQMNSILKSDMKLWNAYIRMLGKIDDLVKSNLLYKKYSKIYPSPELQLNWLTPKTEGP